MRRSGISLVLFSFAIFSLMGVPRPAQASDLSYARIVRLSLVGGDVQISRPGHSGWETASANMPITQGVTIGTNAGRAEVQFEDGSTAWISENALVQFTELALSDGGRITKLTLAQGTVSVYADLKRTDTFVVSTSREQITVPKRSLFRVDAFHDGASISVMQGEVQVGALEGSTDARTLVKGQTLAYKSKIETSAVSASPKVDAWDRWVKSREQTLQTATAQSLSYANAPFSYGMGDLSAYGGWNYFAGYGYGWQPFGMTAGWAPFSMGQWASYPGLGWTWISGEPWGWVPYHFGNWMFSPAYGWTWFPNNFGFWNPAPVNWYSIGNQVGWAPAAPRSGIGSRFPTSPRILIVSNSKSIGNTSSVRIVAAGGNRPVQVLPGGPLENGRAPRVAGAALAANRNAPAQASRALFPTAPSMARLQRSLATSGNIPAMNSRLPAAPAPQVFRVQNAMRMPSASLPHRPAPMFIPRQSAPVGMSSMGISEPQGFGAPGRSGSTPAFSAPRMSGAATGSAPSAPAPHAVASGRPH